MSREEEWIVVDEKIYRIQGAKPKAAGKHGLPAIGPNSSGANQQNLTSRSSGADRLFQENESRLAKPKCTRRRPKELISIDNVSLVTASQVDKIPYCRTNSAPLPALSPSRISPSRISTSPRTPYSAPAKMLSSFQWPSIPEHQGRPDYNSNSVDVSDAKQTKSRMTTRKQNRDVRERFSKTENEGPKEVHERECSLEPKDVDEVFELPPILSSRAQQAASRSPQKAMNVYTAGVGAGQEKIHSKDTVDSFMNVSKQDMTNGIGPRTFSPDSFVAQLIANSKNLTLNDSTESPTLQERKKLARISQKKFF